MLSKLKCIPVEPLEMVDTILDPLYVALNPLALLHGSDWFTLVESKDLPLLIVVPFF